MASEKKSSKQRKIIKKQAGKTQQSHNSFELFGLFAILLTTVIAYWPTIHNDFVNWDDIIYVMNNEMITSFSQAHIAKIFSSFWMGNYHPFTLMSFALDYNLFQLDRPGYHAHNLILHLVNIILIYYFCRLLFKKNLTLAFITAALFAVHPMHVESVAWVSERKDLLYTMYFLAALISYLFYLKRNKPGYILLSMLLFLASLLSKAQAVTLPLVFFLVDYLWGRKITFKTILEKVPFLAVSLVFGIIAIIAQKADNSVNSVGLPLVSSLFYGNYSICLYMFKLVIPVNLICLYEYPFTASGQLPFYVYLSPLVLLLMGIVIWKTWKKYPPVCFGLLFFIFAIFPVLQFLPVGQAVAAERYTYIPYIGLFIIAGFLFTDIIPKVLPQKYKITVIIAGLLILLLFAVGSWNRTQVWKDSIALWTDVMEKNPRSVSAYVNRSYMYNHTNQFDKAVTDCNEGLKLDPRNYRLFANRGIAYRNTGRYKMAVDDYDKVLQLNPKNWETYTDRGTIYTDNLSEYDKGITDFRIFLGHDPSNPEINANMGVAYLKKGVFDSSLVYSLKAISLNPQNATANYVCALAYERKQDYPRALAYGNQAKSLGFAIDDAVLRSWQQKAESGTSKNPPKK